MHRFVDLAQVGPFRTGFLRRPPLRPLQHGADGGEDLAEFVVQREIERKVFSCIEINDLPRQLAAALGKRRHVLEHPPVVNHQVDAGEHHHNQHRGFPNYCCAYLREKL